MQQAKDKNNDKIVQNEASQDLEEANIKAS